MALDLPHLEARTLADFMPAASNRRALEAVLAWPDWPGMTVILDGPGGSGKTHLARIWAERADALYLHASQIWQAADPLARLGAARACVIDDADGIEDERLLLHIYNLLRERGGSLLLTAGRPLAAWDVTLPDLRSRLLTAWPVGILTPDDRSRGSPSMSPSTTPDADTDGSLTPNAICAANSARRRSTRAWSTRDSAAWRATGRRVALSLDRSPRRLNRQARILTRERLHARPLHSDLLRAHLIAVIREALRERPQIRLEAPCRRPQVLRGPPNRSSIHHRFLLR